MSCIKPSDPEPKFEPVNLNQRFMRSMVTAQSSPKLRLTFDDQDIFMDDAEFDDIISKEHSDHQPYRMPNPFRQSAVLPPSPMETGCSPQPVYISSTYTGGIQRDLSGPLHCDVPSLAMQNCRISHNDDRQQHNSANKDQGVSGTDDEVGLLINHQAHVTPIDEYQKQRGECLIPGGQQVAGAVPRTATLTALPRVPVVGDDNVPSTSGNIVTNTSMSMPPPPVPARGQSPTYNSTPTLPAQEGHSSRKRKVSLSSPLIKGFKRILTPTSARKKPKITHLTHEATASNRSLGGVQNRSDLDIVTPTPPPMHSSTFANSDSKKVATTPILSSSSPVPATAPDTPTPPSTRRKTLASALQTINPLHHTRSRSHHERTPSTSSTHQNPTSKTALNALLVSLRSQIADLTLENSVLKDQVAIVRRDWLDVSQELLLEQHAHFVKEMSEFNLKLKVEELTSELARLRRGSLDD